MPWSGGVFNRSNGATGWQDDEAANIGIEAVRHDTLDNDLRDGINATLTKNGTNSPSANLPMAGYRHTGAGNAVGDQDYLTFGQAKAGVNIAVAGTVDYTISQYPGATTTSANLAFQKSRGGAVGTNTIVANGDSLGSITFRGANGTTFTDGAKIEVVVDGTPGATNDMPGAMVFATSADASGTPTERMRINSTGNVKVITWTGTDAAFQTSGQSTAVSGLSNKAGYFAVGSSNTSDAGVVLGSITGNTPYIAASKLSDGTATDLRIYTNDTERMRVTLNGDLCIGNTALTVGSARGIITQGAAANQVVEIIGTAIGNNGSSYAQIKGTNGGNTRTAEIGVTKPTANPNPCGFVRLDEDDAGTNYLWVSNAGNLMISNTYANVGTATGTVVGTQTSDERLKNIKPTPFQYGLQEILALTPVEYELKDELGKNKLGFIAQQTAPILPEVVFNTGDMIPNQDANETKLGMDYSQIIPVLVKAIQQIEARILALEGA